ncbi:MAG: GntR family transcriptional regulator [Clostridiaceae bacterium]|nr:GntR family transcriptional regulator [Clostridiaceae bacterium]
MTLDNHFQDKSPIYLQLINIFTVRIAGGEWVAGQRVDSVRDLAMHFKVNPNTVQRALVEMEALGLMNTAGTSGRYVTSDQESILRARHNLAREELEEFIKAMTQLGYSRDDILQLLEEHISN